MTQSEERTPWERFLSGKLSAASKKLYDFRMKQFLAFAGISDLEFCKLSGREAEDVIERYIQHLTEKAEKGDLSSGTIRPSISPIRHFCKMNRRNEMDWGLLGEQIPKSKKYANDRAPTLEEIKGLLSHAPLRLKAAVLLMVSGGFRLGAFDTLNVGDVTDAGEGIGRIAVYRGSSEEYVTYCTPEAYSTFKDYLAFRKLHGEEVGPKSPAIRNVFDSAGAKEAANSPRRTKSTVLARDLLRMWGKAGIFEALGDGERRHEFKVSHGFRKGFKTICENYMKPIAVETLMGHSTGISDSYYRPTEKELLEEYAKAVPYLTVSSELRQKAEMETMEATHRQGIGRVELLALEKSHEVKELQAQVDRQAEQINTLLSLYEVFNKQNPNWVVEVDPATGKKSVRVRKP
ncbi:MAG: hypothetical protein ACLQEQ_05690 [Nitrososphaerales archaeon]